ncbi:uncharacterized protein HaLaN_26989, partial [Haematococcus lacustris]
MSLLVAEVVGVVPHPKAGDKMRVAELDTGYGRLKVVTTALNVKRGMKVVFAPVGVTTASGLTISQRTLKGVDSFGMLCSAYDIGWSSVADGQLVVLEEDAVVGQPAPQQAPEQNAASLFAALEEAVTVDKAEEQEEQAAAAPAPEAEAAGGKKKKGVKRVGAARLFAALEESVGAGPEAGPGGDGAADQAVTAGSKKKGVKKVGAASLFAALEESAKGGEAAAADPSPQPAGEQPDVSQAVADASSKKKKKKKGGEDIDSLFAALALGEKGGKASKAKEADQELDALLAELDAPKAAAAPGAEGKGKKKKGKGGKS